MKKIVLLIALCAVFPSFVMAREIMASPLEGYWVLNGNTGTESEIAEMVFFGNVLLFKHRDVPAVYFGGYFNHTSRAITIPLLSASWQYQLSGNTLSIITNEGENLTLTKTETIPNPIEGFWRASDDGSIMLLTADIMAVSEGANFMGVKIIINDKWFQPSPQQLGELNPSDSCIEYTLLGKSLLIRHGGEEVELIKVY